MERKERIRLHEPFDHLKRKNDLYVVMGYSSMLCSDISRVKKISKNLRYVRIGNILMSGKEFYKFLDYLEKHGNSVDSIFQFCEESSYQFRIIDCSESGYKFRIHSKYRLSNLDSLKVLRYHSPSDEVLKDKQSLIDSLNVFPVWHISSLVLSKFFFDNSSCKSAGNFL